MLEVEVTKGRYRCANGQTVRLTREAVIHYDDGTNWPGFVGEPDDGIAGLWHLDGRRCRNGLTEHLAAGYDIVGEWSATDAIVDDWMRWR